MNSTTRPNHLFGNVVDMMSKNCGDKVKAMAPVVGNSPLEIAKKHAEIKAYLDKNRSQAFSLRRRAPCIMHENRSCRVNFTPADCASQLEPGDEEAHGALQNAITASVAGAPCLPWTPFGTQLGTGHVAYLAFETWVQDQVQAQFDFSVLENSGSFPPGLLKERLEKTHEIIPIAFGVQDHQ